LLAKLVLEPTTQSTATNRLAVVAADADAGAVPDEVSAAAIGPDNFAGGGQTQGRDGCHSTMFHGICKLLTP